MRDIEANPYSLDEERVADWFCGHGIGGGDDPIASLIVSHEYVVAQRNLMQTVVDAARALCKRRRDGIIEPGKILSNAEAFVALHDRLDEAVLELDAKESSFK